MKRLFVCALALVALGCDTGATEAPSEKTTDAPKLDGDARRARAEAIVAKAKARERVEALSEVELSEEEEEKIRAAAAAEVDPTDVPAAVDALEAELEKALETPVERK